MDIYNNYKHNWNSDRYKTANHIKALDVRQNAGRMIDFYREKIKKHISKKTFLHSDQDVKKQLSKVQDEFKEYQLALYLYGFGYFLEVLLQENFDAAYSNPFPEKSKICLSSIGNCIPWLMSKLRGIRNLLCNQNWLGVCL